MCAPLPLPRSLMLVAAPAFVLLGSLAISETLTKAAEDLRTPEAPDDARGGGGSGDAPRGSDAGGKQQKKASKCERAALLLTVPVRPSAPPPLRRCPHAKPPSDRRAASHHAPARPPRLHPPYPPRRLGPDTSMPWPQEVGAVTMAAMLLGLWFYARHARWVTSEAYSSPSIVLINGRGPNRYVLDDFRWAGKGKAKGGGGEGGASRGGTVGAWGGSGGGRGRCGWPGGACALLLEASSRGSPAQRAAWAPAT